MPLAVSSRNLADVFGQPCTQEQGGAALARPVAQVLYVNSYGLIHLSRELRVDCGEKATVGLRLRVNLE